MPFSFKPPQVPAQQAFSAVAIGNKIKENKGQIFTFAAFLLVGVAVFVSVVLYTYQASLHKSVEGLKAALAAEDSKIGEMSVGDMAKVSRRLKATSLLVSQHVSANSALRLLEEIVEDKSLFKTFDIKLNAKGQYECSVTGIAPSYKAIVQQTESLKLKMYSKYIVNSELLSVSLTDDGNVNFTYKIIFNIRGVFPELITIDASGDSSNISASSTGR